MSKMKWIKFKNTGRDRQGTYLVLLDDGVVRLGTFYCGAFVMDGFCYNETPEIINSITHIQKVTQ